MTVKITSQTKANAPPGIRGRRASALTNTLPSSGEPRTNIRQLTNEIDHLKLRLKEQNKLLQKARLELACARDEHVELCDSSPTGYVSLADDTTIKHANRALCAMLGLAYPIPSNTKFSRFVALEVRETLMGHLREARAGEKKVSELLLHRADGSSFAIQMVSAPFTPLAKGRHTSHNWIVDLSAHKRANHALQASEQRCRELFERAPLCMFMIDLTAPQAIIREANSRARLVYGYTGDELRGMLLAHLAPEDTCPIVDAMVAQVQQGVTVTNETVHKHRDGTRFTVRINATADPTDKHCMLMIVEDTTAEHLRRSEAQAIDAERRRMSHEIHDSVAQRLAALCMRCALWHRLADSTPPALHAVLSELQEELNAAIEDIRRAIFAVRPVELNELGFLGAVTQWVNGFSLQNKLQIQVNYSGMRENLSSTYELPLFRIIQEAFSNILRHARASTAHICLTVDAAGGVVLTVGDDGRGFDTTQVGPAAQAPHFGLPQMRERILELAGTLVIRSELGRGTELVVSLPPVTRQVQEAAYKGPQRRIAARRQKDRA